MNIWLVNPFDGLPGESFRPGRYAFLSRLLTERGHRVTWWSSNFFHATKSFRGNGQDRIRPSENLDVVLVKTPGYRRNISLHRMWNHFIYARGFVAQASRDPQPPDVIIASTPPLLAASAALGLGERRGARVLIDVQDIWPEAFDVAFPRKLRPVAGMLFWPLRRLADRVYDRADGLTAVSDTFLSRALSASGNKGKGLAVPLGVDLGLYQRCLDQRDVDMPYVKHDPGEFRAIYIGTIGKSYDVGTIVKAAAIMAGSRPDVRFIVAGDGPQLSEMRRRAAGEDLTNITFTGMISYARIVELLSRCQAGINAVSAGSAIAMPNKCFDYMAAGLPLISSVKGELERLIIEERIGVHYEAGDAESFVKAVLQLRDNSEERHTMGVRARRLAEERFDMRETYGRFEELALALQRSGGL